MFEGGALYPIFRPRTCPKTFLQCFALEQRESKAKHCRNVLGWVLGQKNYIGPLASVIRSGKVKFLG